MRRKVRKAPKPYRHIYVSDNVDRRRQVRTVTVECPLEYPGLSGAERQKMNEGLEIIAEVFRKADKRCERNYYNRMK